MNEEDKRKVKIGIAISAFAVLLLVGLQNLSALIQTARFLLGVLSPFLFGVCIAFVLNIPLHFLEHTVFAKLNRKKLPRFEKMRRPLCVILVFLFFLGLIAALLSFILPQLVQSVRMLGENMSGYLDSFEGFVNRVLAQFQISADFMETLQTLFTRFSGELASFISSSLPKVDNTASTITVNTVNFFLGLIMAVYMLMTKESLIRTAKSVLYAYLPQKHADWIKHVYEVLCRRFHGFVAGQLTEAFILGVLCYIGMTLFQMPYALLISVIIGLTNLVPIIGPIIGTIPGALLMLMINPMSAVWFVLFIIVLQQIESNLIYPKVVGDSIGLPGLWVLFAVTVGGGLFGLPGVLLGVPAFAVIYTLLRESVSNRLKAKKRNLSKTEKSG